MITANGQLMIGASSGRAIRSGLLGSSDGSITWTVGAGTITGQVSGGTTVGKTLTPDSGGAVSPIAGNWNVKGTYVAASTTPVYTSGTSNTLTVNVQTAQTTATTNVNKIGLAAFNSADFSVDANGFVSVISEGLTWSAITANQALAVGNGYICISAGGALSLSLPTTAAVGSVIVVALDGATSWTITQGAGQQIRIGNQQSTSGAGGTLASTAQGDTITLVCSVANLKFNVTSSMGNITVV